MVAYHASAIAFAGEIVRPVQSRIPAQAAVVLPETGGYESTEVKDIELNGFVSIGLARSKAAGSYDEAHNSYTTYSLSVLEKVNLCDVVTADRIVVRQSCTQQKEDKGIETRFNLVGTHFENLSVAGHPVDIALDIGTFSEVDTFSKLEHAYQQGGLDHFVHGRSLPREVDRYENPILSSWLRQSQKISETPRTYSLANHLRLEARELKSFGSIILVPDFGIVSLAELTVGPRHRKLSLLRLYLGSPIEGRLFGPTCSVGDDTESTGPR
jgi:hypothetical protein